MATHDDRLKAVLGAAEELLAAREVDMLTTDEWDALEHVVASAKEPQASGDASYTIEDDELIRRVTPNHGEPYEQRCSREDFEQVVRCIDELEGRAFTFEDIRRSASVPWSRAAVALMFMRDRGWLGDVKRRHYAARSGACLDTWVTLSDWSDDDPSAH